MFEAILQDFGWASLLLLIGMFLRKNFTILQKGFIPVSVIAGLFGILIGPEVLGKFCPIYIHWSDNVSSFANPLLGILFVSQFISLNFNTKMLRKMFIFFFISFTTIAAQVLSAMALGRVFGLPDGASLLPFSGFYGAHGIPQTVAGIYKDLHYWSYDAASAFGTTYATFGMLWGVIVGITILNIGIRKGWTAAGQKGSLTQEDYTGLLEPEHQKPFMKAYTSDIALEPLALHFSIILTIMIIAYGLLNLLHRIPLFSGFAIYVPAIIVAMIFGAIAKRTKLGNIVDADSCQHVGSLALEYLISTAIATMKLDVVFQNFGAIVTICLTGLILTTLILLVLPKIWLRENWLENAIVMFGSWTGSTATGLMLLRIADPDLETDAGPNLIAATPLWQISTQNFYLAIAPTIIVSAAGFKSLAMGTFGGLIVAIIAGFILAGKKK